MKDKTHEELCKSLIGLRIDGVSIDGSIEPAVARLTFDRGFVEFEGENLELYIEIDDLN